jgi:hypothetical protein
VHKPTIAIADGTSTKVRFEHKIPNPPKAINKPVKQTKIVTHTQLREVSPSPQNSQSERKRRSPFETHWSVSD